MAEQKTGNSTSKKAENFISKNSKIIITVTVVIVCALIAYLVGTYVGGKIKGKDLSAIDNIYYDLTNDSVYLESSEIETRRADAFEKLVPYTKKAGVTGVRANMICAELAFQQEKYEESANYWKAVASKSGKAYTAPIAYYNLGVCYEQTGKLDDACEAYKKAAANENFALRAHAAFSYGRALEAKGDYKGAVAAYTELNDRSPDDSWANLAKTRILVLQVEGKAE